MCSSAPCPISASAAGAIVRDYAFDSAAAPAAAGCTLQGPPSWQATDQARTGVMQFDGINDYIQLVRFSLLIADFEQL